MLAMSKILPYLPKLFIRNASTIHGHATSSATSAFCERIALANRGQSLKPLLLPRSHWTASPIGFGTRRLEPDVGKHTSALSAALTAGCNVIDCNSAFEAGKVEKIVGTTVSKLVTEKRIGREELIVMTKTGNIRGDDAADALQHKYSDLVVQGDQQFSMAPEYLERALTRSLQRLRLDCVDVFFLTNTEIWFEQDPDGFYERLSRSFAHLESEVKRGRIQYYGIASNTIAFPPSKYPTLDLDRIVAAANSVSANHHFGAIQYYFNIVEAEAALVPNQRRNTATLQVVAQEHQLMQFTQRPLSVTPGLPVAQLVERANTSTATSAEQLSDELNVAFKRAIYQEMSYPANLPAAASAEQRAAVSKLPAFECAHWAREAYANIADLQSVSQWKAIVSTHIEPGLQQFLRDVRTSKQADEWALTYSLSLYALFEKISELLQRRANSEVQQLKQTLDNVSGKLTKLSSVQTKSLAVLLSLAETTGKQVTLVGMRDELYVRELFKTLPENDYHLNAAEANAALRASFVDKVAYDREQEARHRQLIAERAAIQQSESKVDLQVKRDS
eukprot:TRINITY_DN2805_c0_g1_i1.p2 TRINITY_DN2805_c0_g1~~TRINITY_DN2805_c0_g1_i1.p2  ORF type:complete len:561 (-),score=112.68 TRINITY_DN2805_c0_g1_i1:1847-3529(-)